MKKMYQSKTVWFNFLLLVLAMFDRDFFATLGVTEAALPKIEIILVKVCAIGNLALRYFTTAKPIEPIGGNKEENQNFAIMAIAVILAI